MLHIIRPSIPINNTIHNTIFAQKKINERDSSRCSQPLLQYYIIVTSSRQQSIVIRHD